MRLGQTIVAGNTIGGGTESDCVGSGTFADRGYNLVGAGGGCPASAAGSVVLAGALSTAVSPALANNGGPTLTHNPVPGGPGVDRIPTASCARATDQRGVARPQGVGCDIGAVEYHP